MTFSLRVELVNDGLLGGDYEAAPSIAYWGTWGAHRLATRVPLEGTPPQAVMGPFAIPAASVPVAGDEQVWFKEVAQTHRSGIPSIDAVESKHVARNLLEGTGSLALAEILRVAATSSSSAALNVPLEQIMLEVQLNAENEHMPPDQLDAMALKGMLRVTPVFADTAASTLALAAVKRLDAAAAAPPGGQLLYGSPAFQAAHMRSVTLTVGETYSPAFFASANGGPPQWPLGAETSIDKLHLPRYMGDQGSQPPVAFLLHDVETRDHPRITDIQHYASVYAYNDESARFFNDLLLGALRREGLDPDTFVAAVTAQEAQSPADAHVSDGYLRACAAVHETGTYVANAMHYKSDMVWKNRSYYQQQQEAAPPSAAAATTTTSSVATVAAVRRVGTVAHLRATNVPAAKEAAAVIEAVEMESFDTAPVQGYVNSGDCEDMSNMGSTVLRAMERVAALPVARQMPVLQAAARVMSRRFVLDVAASVTAAFVNTEGKELSGDELKAFKDLPLIGSPEDARKKIGGHCHGLSQSRASVYDMLVRAHGAARVNADLPQLAAEMKAAPTWARALPTIVLEGTSSVDPWVLPVSEVSAGLGEAAQARRNLIKAARMQAPTLMDSFKTEGLGFYAQAPADSAQRRVSSFYLGLSHVLSPELYKQHPLYGQMAVVDAARRTRGLEIGTYLRASLPAHNADSVAGLAPVFYGMGRDRWEREVRPVMAAIQNQMPLNKFARFASGATARVGAAAATPVSVACSSRGLSQPFEDVHVLQNHPVSFGMFQQLASMPADPANPTALTQRLEGHAHHFAQESGTLLASVQLQPLGVDVSSATATQRTGATATTHLCFFSRPWRLAIKPDTASKVEQELAALKAKGYLTSYRLVHDRPLPQADDVVTLEMALPVPGPGAPPPAPAPAAASVPATSTKNTADETPMLAAMRMATPFWERGRM